MAKEDLRKLRDTLRALKREKENLEKEEDSEVEAAQLALQAQGVEEIQKIGEAIIDSNAKTLEALNAFTISVPEIVIPDIIIPEIKSPQVNIPQIKVPTITIPKIEVPRIEIPEIKVPTPKVTVNVPDIKVPTPKVTVNAPEITEVGLRDVNDNNPLPVILRDKDGNLVDFGGGSNAVSGGARVVKVSEVQKTVTTKTDVRNVVSIQGSDSPSTDAFGRWRVSNPQTIFDSKQIHDNQPLFWDDSQVSGAATGTSYSSDTASTVISVGDTTAGRRVRQTYQRFNYQPGKSQLILMTGVMNKSGGGAGIREGMGVYDDNNGLFLESQDGTYKFVRRTSTGGGGAVDNEVTQPNWSLDKMDGTGESGVELDFSKAQILVIDFEWLGVGRVRMGFNVNGKTYYAHEFNNANNLSEVYMSTPNLPLRYEIENDGTGVPSSLEHICSSVMSEGGVQNLGVLRHQDSGSTTGMDTGVKYALVGIRLKSTYLGTDTLIENISALATTKDDQAHWELILNPTVEGAFTYSDQTNSGLQVATASGSLYTVTGGYELDGGYFSTSVPVNPTAPNARRLGAAIDGTVDEIVLVAKPITNNIGVEGSVTWREIS